MANKTILILLAAAVAIIIDGTAVALPSFTQQKPEGQSRTSTPGNDASSTPKPSSTAYFNIWILLL
jgi:hypothetical protein